ncbi:MAG: UDP-N-acetylmuramate--L-alanine ligase [Clostridia bacterium]|nr:UDP-N-acetylmuramate--L-alanine ligase [Clostridia bacterium]
MQKTFTSLKDMNKIHMIGIGGISMSAIALALKKYGYVVTGSDKTEGDMIQILEENNIPVYIGSNAELVKDADIVVYTSAINQHDPEFVRAKTLGIPTYERAKFLGLLLQCYDTPICICGTHGKTTTTSMVASIFIDAGLDPNIQVGSKFKKLNDLNYRIGESEYYILESCEYVDSFLNFPHQTATVLNIDEDHLDYFSGIEEIKASFKKFILMLPKDGILIINYDDLNCMEILNEVRQELEKRNVKIYTFSLSEPEATVYAKNVFCNVKGFYSFELVYEDTSHEFYLTVPGIHNVYDALAAITTSLAHGISFESMEQSLNEFCGAKRRFEYKKNIGKNILVYDDYAHHPTEIKATLAAAKQKEHNRIIAVFQPHTYTRTKELLYDFATSFNDADIVIISDIYAAREIDEGVVSSKDLVDLIQKNKVDAHYIATFDKIVAYLKDIIQEDDIILTIGAGDITHLSDML